MYNGNDLQRVLLAQLETLSKKIPTLTLNSKNVYPVRALRCDFYGEGHQNGHSTPESYIAEAHYAINYQEPDPYFNTYPRWYAHSSRNWGNNQSQNFNPEPPRNPPPRKSSRLEEALCKLMRSFQSNFRKSEATLKIPKREPSSLEEALNQFMSSQRKWEARRKIMQKSSKNLKASLNNFENYIRQIPGPLVAKSSEVHDVNMLDNPRDEEVEIEFENEWEVVDDG